MVNNRSQLSFYSQLESMIFVTISIREAFKGLYRLCQCPGKDRQGCKVLIPVLIKNRDRFQRFARNHHGMGKIGRLSANYKTGINESNNRKYIRILRPYHKYAHKDGYVSLHRYLKELDLGYYIPKGFDVHHIDENTRNNSPENLQVLLKLDHAMKHNPIKDHSKTICSLCGSNKTLIKPSGRPLWYGNEIDGYSCKHCYDKLVSIPKRKLKRIEK